MRTSRLYRERLAELDRERDLGEIEADRYAALREDLERGLLADVDEMPAARIATHPPPRWMGAAVTLMVPACGLAIYLWLGSPHALDPRAQSSDTGTVAGIEQAQPRDHGRRRQAGAAA